MKKIVSLSLLFLFVLSFVACGDDDKEDGNVVPTTAFFLPEGCTWKGLEKDKVYRIESMSELNSLVDVGEGAKLPEIDFENKSMVMVVTRLHSKGLRIDYKMWSKGGNKYYLNIMVFDDVIVLPAPSVYYLAVLTDKLEKNCSVDYDIQFP